MTTRETSPAAVQSTLIAAPNGVRSADEGSADAGGKPPAGRAPHVHRVAGVVLFAAAAVAA